MKKRVTFACGMALVAAGAVNPAAAAEEGLYGAIFGGANIRAESEGTATATFTPGTFAFTLESKVGALGGAALGYRFGGGFRLEGEVSYRYNDWNSASTPGTPATTPITGDVEMLGLMANGYFDFDVGSNMALYVGGGVGAAIGWVTLGAPTLGSVSSGGKTAFAYQGIAGGSVDVGGGTELFLEYRYFGTTDFSFFGSGVSIEADYSSHAVAVGLRIPL